MKFEQDKNGFKIRFSIQEVEILKEKGELSLDFENGRHLVNHLANITAEIHKHIMEKKPEVLDKTTTEDTEINLK